MPENWDAYHEKEYFALEALRQAIEKAEKQEKLCKYCGGIGRVVCDGRCMPKREWVGLTDEEIDYLEDAIDPAMYRVFARRIEAKLKEKNNV
jgi:hypothetical protein